VLLTGHDAAAGRAGQRSGRDVQALADPVRLRLFSLIAAGAATRLVCDLTETFELSGPTMSYHLKTLRKPDWSAQAPRHQVYYRLIPQALEQLAAVLTPTPALAGRPI
jgi:ArsR family transcriptional regulator